jgi:chorismate mutase
MRLSLTVIWGKLHGPAGTLGSILSLHGAPGWLKAWSIMSAPPPVSPDLAQLRREIDAVDDRILELLLQRFALGQSVAEAKRNLPPAPNMRPAREAEILRRLAARWRGPAPVSTMAAIWRHIISSVLGLQGRFTVHLTEEDRRITPALAANHFSAGAQFQTHRTYEHALTEVSQDLQSIAILALPAGQPPSPWWSGLHHGPLRVVARLPFLEPVSDRAYVVALQEPAPSGDDISLAWISGGGRPWADVQAAAPDLRLLASDGDRYLAEGDGFWDQRDTAARRSTFQTMNLDFQTVGAFARPLQISRTST